jgi:hypothetical protein
MGYINGIYSDLIGLMAGWWFLNENPGFNGSLMGLNGT